jgi:hypothetical protein
VVVRELNREGLRSAQNERRYSRVRLRADAHFRWKAPGSSGPSQMGCGVTLDISAVGAFVLAEECPPAGSAVELVIRLPGISGFASAVELRAQGQVRRVMDRPGDAPARRTGFAAEFEEYELMEVAS